MTHKFLYIESGNILDDSARMYFVYIGANSQANRDYLWLTAYSVEKGHFFELYTKNVADFMLKVCSSLPNLPLPLAINARELVRHFKNGTRPALSAAHLTNKNHSMNCLYLNYRSAHPRP